MRVFWSIALILLLCTCGPAPGKERLPPVAPNILFILTDDQGIGDLSLHGNDSIRTPNLDALLRGSARFDRFYVSPVCAPTRAGFLSGMYPPRTGAIFVTRRRETMDDATVTLAEYLQRAGYRTGLYGKWHNGATFPYYPGGQGFDEFLGFTLGHFNDYFRGELRDEEDAVVPFAADLTQLLTDSAAHFMESSPQPFFCLLAYQAPHTPVQVADRYWDAVQQRGLTDFNTGVYAMVESVDDRIGELLARLETSGKLANTIVVFASDNGPNGDRYRQGLRGVKGQVDEGGVRVPFSIRLPGAHPANGRVISVPAAHIDLLPTLLDLIGQPVPTGLDGVSLRPLLEGRSIADRFVYASGQGYPYTGYPGSMRDARYLYVARDSLHHELYDLARDPGQESNIYAEVPQVGDSMADRYRRFARSIDRPDLVAPPIDLDGAPGEIRLLAHEGEPLGSTHFSDENGWANDFFVDLGVAGAYWPVVARAGGTYELTLSYHLDAPGAQRIRIGTDAGENLESDLPVAITHPLPVPDRVPRKEVYPRDWAERKIGRLKIPVGSTRLEVGTATQAGAETGLWIKEVRLRRVEG